MGRRIGWMTSSADGEESLYQYVIPRFMLKLPRVREDNTADGTNLDKIYIQETWQASASSIVPRRPAAVGCISARTGIDNP